MIFLLVFKCQISALQLSILSIYCIILFRSIFFLSNSRGVLLISDLWFYFFWSRRCRVKFHLGFLHLGKIYPACSSVLYTTFTLRDSTSPSLHRLVLPPFLEFIHQCKQWLHLQLLINSHNSHGPCLQLLNLWYLQLVLISSLNLHRSTRTLNY